MQLCSLWNIDFSITYREPTFWYQTPHQALIHKSDFYLFWYDWDIIYIELTFIYVKYLQKEKHNIIIFYLKLWAV